MAGKPIATLGSMHVCPMCSGLIPHVGGPITGPGCPGVLINGKPIALMGDMCVCEGPPDVIVTGCRGVLVNGVPVACVGDMTAHGGSITIGEMGVTISAMAPNQTSVMPLLEIPFPEYTIMNKVLSSVSGNSGDLAESKENTEQIKEDEKLHGFLSEYTFSA